VSCTTHKISNICEFEPIQKQLFVVDIPPFFDNPEVQCFQLFASLIAAWLEFPT